MCGLIPASPRREYYGNPWSQLFLRFREYFVPPHRYHLTIHLATLYHLIPWEVVHLTLMPAPTSILSMTATKKMDAVSDAGDWIVPSMWTPCNMEPHVPISQLVNVILCQFYYESHCVNYICTLLVLYWQTAQILGFLCINNELILNLRRSYWNWVH